MKRQSEIEHRRREMLRQKREKKEFRRRKFRRLRRSGEGVRDRVNRIWHTQTLRAPAWLTLQVDQPAERAQTLRFFEKVVSTPSVKDRTAILVDLRDCVKIDITAAVVLIANIEIAQIQNPDTVSGADPIREEPALLLRALNFHQHLRYEQPDSGDRVEGEEVLQIETRSGGLGATAGERMPLAAEAISEILPRRNDLPADLEFLKEQIHSAINEALLNILTHAYSSPNPTAYKSSVPSGERRWWAIGIVNRRLNHFDLIVFDRGVGIPQTLKPSTWEGFSSAFGFEKQTDALRIQAAMEYGRTSKRKGALGGKGMPEMLDLIGKFPNSMLLVESLKGIYVATNASGGTTHSSRNAPSALPGTMIYWHLDLSDEN